MRHSDDLENHMVVGHPEDPTPEKCVEDEYDPCPECGGTGVDDSGKRCTFCHGRGY